MIVNFERSAVKAIVFPLRSAKIMSFARAFAATLLATALTPVPSLADPLEDGFKNPPASARPRVWWHWMNGNVTEEGIKLDLEWMKRIGIGGIQNFDAQLRTPQVVEKRLVYMTPEWKKAFRLAAQTADQLGLEMAIAASPGWSETGGPWVAPQDGMKKLVWSETTIAGGKPYRGKLAQIAAVTGPFQDMSAPADPLTEIHSGKGETPRLYRDTHVIAYRTEAPAAAPRFSVSSGTDSLAVLNDGRYSTAFAIPKGAADKPAWVRADYTKPQVIRSASLAMPPAWLFGAGPYEPVVEASADGTTFVEVARFPNKSSPQYTVSFAPVTAKAMRIMFRPSSAPFSLPSPPAPGVDFSALGGFGAGAPSAITVNEVAFSSAPRVHRFEEKAAFAMHPDYYAIASPDAAGIAASDVIDLTEKMAPDGTLDWTPPKGNWRVLRFGYSLTGKENHPATPEATGLEVDKFDAEAVKRYINTYLDTYVSAAGADLVGKRGVRAVLNDSIEVGAANWTDRLVGEFKARRGYDPTLWMPALTGVIIGSASKTDAFLYDFRKTLAELIETAHYATITTELHKRDLIHYSEALESGRPSIGDDMAMRKTADIPMAAMWTYPKGDIGPQPSYWGDIRGAASVAHIYGQNLVAAESLTAAMSFWSFAPRDLQPMIDMEFALGVNRPVIHTSVHQPLTDKMPGFSLWIFGQYFSRLETWGEMAKPWIDYISRNSYMLQQGRFAADVAYFYGEESPITALYDSKVPTDTPTTTGFDYVNADVVLNQLSNDGRDLVAKSGARFRLIYLGGTSRKMTLPVLKRLDALVQGGATLVGAKPDGTPSLSDDPAAFAALANALWGGATGKGRVLASTDVNAALKTLGIAPDFTHTNPASDTTVMFVHRTTPDADIYYFTNRKDRTESVDLSFRMTGKIPELWDAATGASTGVGFDIKDGRTTIPMVLRPYQSGYIVFRKPAGGVTGTAKGNMVVKSLGDVSGPWSLSFQSGRRAPARVSLPQLIDWSKDKSPEIKYFSGIGTYRHDLVVPQSALGKGQALMLDLGDVHDVAEVLVNGKAAGTLWKAPYRLDISGVATTGKNTLEIRVANLWVNRLIGDAQPGAKPITFTTLKTYTAGAPLRPSGLIGPVKLETETR
jgi:alpha-L-rhamnosidase